LLPVVGIDDDFNLYAYVANDPINRSDPSGLEGGCVVANSCEQNLDFEGTSAALSTAADALDYADANYFTPMGPAGGLEHLAVTPIIAGLRGLSGGSRAATMGRVVSRIANRQNVINQRHIQAALREARGEVVALRSDGKPFDHIKELREAAAGLKNDLVKTKELLGSGKLDDAATDAAQRALSEGSKLLDVANNVLKKVDDIKVCRTGSRIC